MALLNEAIEAKKFDVRVIEKHVSRGVISAEVAQKNTASLPDDAANAEWISQETLEPTHDSSND